MPSTSATPGRVATFRLMAGPRSWRILERRRAGAKRAPKTPHIGPSKGAMPFVAAGVVLATPDPSRGRERSDRRRSGSPRRLSGGLIRRLEQLAHCRVVSIVDRRIEQRPRLGRFQRSHGAGHATAVVLILRGRLVKTS